MKKIINDTLKTNGKWSRKSLTILTTFVFILMLGTFIVISDKILEKEVNRYAISVFDSLLVFEGLLMGLSEASKKFINKQAPINEE
jgi:hypothetical protein